MVDSGELVPNWVTLEIKAVRTPKHLIKTQKCTTGCRKLNEPIEVLEVTRAARETHVL